MLNPNTGPTSVVSNKCYLNRFQHVSTESSKICGAFFLLIRWVSHHSPSIASGRRPRHFHPARLGACRDGQFERWSLAKRRCEPWLADFVSCEHWETWRGATMINDCEASNVAMNTLIFSLNILNDVFSATAEFDAGTWPWFHHWLVWAFGSTNSHAHEFFWGLIRSAHLWVASYSPLLWMPQIPGDWWLGWCSQDISFMSHSWGSERRLLSEAIQGSL